MSSAPVVIVEDVLGDDDMELVVMSVVLAFMVDSLGYCLQSRLLRLGVSMESILRSWVVKE